MKPHPFTPSGHANATGQPLDSCLQCGKTEAAHDLVLTWNDREFRFPSAEAARRAGFYPDGFSDVVEGSRRRS